MADWWDNIVSGFNNDPWGAIGNAGAIGSLGLGAFSSITGALRAMDQQRQADRVNKSVMDANQQNRQAYGAQTAQYQQDQAARDEANRLNLAQYQRDQATRDQANQLNLSGYQQAVQQAQVEAQRRNAVSEQLRTLATSPIDAGQFYSPISDAESTARKRAIMADLISRGGPADSAFATNLVGEQMAGTESQRFQQALQAAIAARGQQEQTLTSVLPGVPTWGSYAPHMGGTYAPQVSPGYPKMTAPFGPQAGPGYQAQQGQFPPGVDMSSPFAWLYANAKRKGDQGTATVGPPRSGPASNGMSMSANEMAQQGGAPGWSDYGSGAGWRPQEPAWDTGV